jgi:cysteine desulfurase family protein
MERIYLDNAATSWPKPDAVYAAVDAYMRNNGASAGRSGYSDAAEATRLVETVRRGVARLLGIGDSNRLVFTFNGTDSLNLAIHGVLSPGDHVVTTVIEHNSVLRPLRALEAAGAIEITYATCNAQGIVDPEGIKQALRANTRLVVMSHASNVTGAIQDVRAVAAITHEREALLLVDAAQTVGHLTIDADVLGADMIAASGHKGLLGPLGTGLCYLRPGIEHHVRTIRQGGTGTHSEEDLQPEDVPTKFESGNRNMPGIAGLAAAVEYHRAKAYGAVRAHEQALMERLLVGLFEIPGVTVYGPSSAEDRVGLVSMRIEGYDPQEVAAALDSAHHIQVRPGLHCAPRMHEALGTIKSGGTVRLSVGQFNTLDEIDQTISAIAELAASRL